MTERINDTARSLDFDLLPGEDPVDRFGYGIKSYFDLILWLIGLFAILSIIHIPLILFYGEGHSLEDNKLT